MMPYADFLYFALVGLYVVVPTLIIRLIFGFSRTWILVATVFMLIVQYGGFLDPTPPGSGTPEICLLGAYAVFQGVVAFGFLVVRARTSSRAPFIGALILALAPLALAKLLPVWLPDPIVGFLGISYISFRALDVLIGIQDKLILSLSPCQYLAYLFFFPAISSGPIDRYRRFAEDWKRRHTRAELLQDLDGAVQRIFDGFFLKFILAALVREYWMDPVDPAKDGRGFLDMVSFMYAYSCYLFFDFAGYSAFAIGVSYLLGIHTPENFNRPYLATNIRDFWNRWHITLTSWLRDHVYMRFLLAALHGRWFKNKETASYVGIFLAFVLMGLWHGIELVYLIYGVYHAVLMVGYEWFSRWNKQRHLWGEGPLWRIAGALLTLQLVCFGLLLFSGRLGPWLFRGASS